MSQRRGFSTRECALCLSLRVAVTENRGGFGVGELRLTVPQLSADRAGAAGVGGILYCHADVEIPVIRGLLVEDRLCEHAVLRDVQGLLHINADVAVDAGALIPPALGGQTVYVNGDRVDPVPEERAVSDIYVERSVSAERSSHERTVHIHPRRDRHALEREHDMLSGKFRRENERLAVPRVVSALVAVRDEVVGRKLRLCHVVVREVYDFPIAVVKVHVRYSALLSCLGGVVGIGMRLLRFYNSRRREEAPLFVENEFLSHIYDHTFRSNLQF